MSAKEFVKVKVVLQVTKFEEQLLDIPVDELPLMNELYPTHWGRVYFYGDLENRVRENIYQLIEDQTLPDAEIMSVDIVETPSDIEWE